MKKTAFFLFTFLLFGFGTHLTVYADVAYERGISTTSYKGRCSKGRPSNSDVHFETIRAAKKAAWDNYTAGFSPSKLENYLNFEQTFTSDLETYITEYVILETDCSKKERTYMVALKASINKALVDVKLNKLSGDTGNASVLNGKFVVSLIIARRVQESKSFDARRTVQEETISSIDVDQESYDDGTSIALSEQTTERKKVSTGGSTTRKAERRSYDIGDQKNAEVAIEQAFLRAKMRLVKPSRIEKVTGTSFMDRVRSEYAGISDSDRAELSDQTFEQIVEAIITLGRIDYLIAGTMDTSAPRVDPDTGLQKVDVYITMELSRIDPLFGAEKIALVGPELRSGLHETESGAEIAALKLAAESATDMLLNRLSN